MLVRETYEPYFWKTAFSSKMPGAHQEFTAVSVAMRYIDSSALMTQPDSASSGDTTGQCVCVCIPASCSIFTLPYFRRFLLFLLLFNMHMITVTD